MWKIHKIIGAVSFCAALLQTSTAMAHVKWFIDTEKVVADNFQAYSLTDPVVLSWIALAFTMLIIATFLDGKLPSPPIVSSKLRHDVIELLRICTGMSLLLTAYDGSLVAPHYEAYGVFGTCLLFLQGFIGIVLISNRMIFQCAILMIMLYVGIIIQFGISEVLEYCNILGIALFLMFNSFTTPALQEKYKPYSVAVLRIFTGIALVTLGVTEKLLGAKYGEAFIATFDWNFMANLGAEIFTDRLFVLSAGVMEVVFGCILILGVVTRLNTLVIAVFMLLSNITFMFQSNQPAALIELIGHLPIIASAVILLFLGYGQRLKVTTLFDSPQKSATADLSTPQKVAA